MRVVGLNQYKNLNFLLNKLLEEAPKESGGSSFNVDCIIFSKDRPLQLHALLGSMIDCLIGCRNIHILYQSSSKDYNKAYEKLGIEFNYLNLQWYKEDNFRLDLFKILKKIDSKILFFLVDDIIFIEKVNLYDFKNIDIENHIISLRLGRNLSYCYMSDAKQRLPKFLKNSGPSNNKFLFWLWSKGKWDWGYPLSLDGHLFPAYQIKRIINLTEFKSPNSLEGAIQIFSDLFKQRLGVCYEKSRIVNIPNNKVQDENKNRFQGNDHLELLKLWNQGFRINYQHYYGYNNKSTHEELDLN